MSPDIAFLERLLESAARDAVPEGARARALAKLEVAPKASRSRLLRFAAGPAAALAIAAGVALFIHVRREANRRAVATIVPEPAAPQNGAVTRPAMAQPIACSSVLLPDGPPTSCSTPDSRTEGEPLLLEVVNSCSSETIDLYWVNSDCKEVFYHQLVPGERYPQSTFASHAWRLRDHASRRLLKEVAAATSNSGRPDTVVRTTTEIVQPSDQAVEDANARSEAGVPAELIVVNNRSAAIELYWLDYDGKEQFKGVAEPGARWRQHTQDAHRWHVRDAASRRLLKDFAIAARDDGPRAYVVVP